MRPLVTRLVQQHSHSNTTWTHGSAVQRSTGSLPGHAAPHAAAASNLNSGRLRTCASSDRTADAGGGTGRVYLITGSTDGIGRHTALKLAQTGATVLVHGRDPKRVSDTVELLSKVSSSSSSSSSSSIQGYTADLSDMSAVRWLAAAVASDHPRLTALVKNAGVYETQKRLSVDGYEMTWAVNVLGPFLLTSLLWQHVDEVIITTASISAASSINLQQLPQQQQQQQQQYSAHSAYSLSKLCDIIFTLRLHQWLQQQGSNVKANTLDPGTVNTKMLLAGWGRIGMEVGEADNTFKLLTDVRMAGASGKYFVGHRETRPPSVAEEPKVQQQLWELWTQQTGAEWSGPVSGPV